MSSSTQFASQSKNGKPSIALTDQTPLATAIKLMQQGDVAPAVFLDWATKTPIDLTECFALVGAIGQKDFAIVMQAQREMIARAAAQKTGGAKSFAISDTDKGVLKITLPGMMMPFSPPVEALECLLEHSDECRKYLAGNGERVKAKRAAYKQSEEYAATVAKMRNNRK